MGALIAIGICVPATAAAQGRIPARVRVMTSSEQIMRWLGPVKDVILVVDQGTTLEVLDFDEDKNSYWVILPPDLHGTRKVGWIRASSVDPDVAAPAPDTAPASSDGAPLASPPEAQRDGATTPAPSSSATIAPGAAAEAVTLSVQRNAPSPIAADTAAARKSYTFEDVHFERDRFALRSEDIDRLRVAASAMKADASLVLTIEGHTCSLGTGTYNLALGERRATAVKDYFLSAGVPADRLRTVSRGEAGAEYDNAREETRKLNRRVALVPKIQR